jgi:hypothetical protein
MVMVAMAFEKRTGGAKGAEALKSTLGESSADVSTGDNEIRRTAHIDSKGLSEKQTARPTTQ